MWIHKIFKNRFNSDLMKNYFVYLFLIFSQFQMISLSKSNLGLQDRMKAALFGLYVADAVAMPVHWMYDLRNL